jgi:hypothetical protein
VSEQMLHLRSPDRWGNVAAIVGDRTALEALRRAVEAALRTGSGGAFLFSSDGEGYDLAVALEENMWNVQTAYANETAPVRSLREVIPIHAVLNFRPALCKAMRSREQFALPTVQGHEPAGPHPNYGAAVRCATDMNAKMPEVPNEHL